MLTQALYVVGKAIIRGPAHAKSETDSMKLLEQSNVELNLAVGSVVLCLIGFLLIFALGLPSEWIWKSKAGADAGGGLFAIGITGYLLHYVRSRTLKRRAEQLDRGRMIQDPLRTTFWTRSSDIDLLFQLAIGIIVFGLTYAS
jgi:hypothetical protein